jgi:hypothetical protein
MRAMTKLDASCGAKAPFLAAALAAGLMAAGAVNAGPASAAPPAASDGGPVVAKASVGEFSLSMIPPAGMTLVTGLCPAGDKFLYLLNERFKLVVLAAYADAEVYKDFCNAMTRDEYRPVPNIALVTVPRKMHERSYDGKRTAKELKRYVTWFTLATNTRLIALGFEAKANSAMSKKIGYDLDFSYDLGDASKVFHRTPSSLGIGVLTSVRLGNGRSDNFLAAAVYQMSDKLVFLSMIGRDRSKEGVAALRSELLAWGRDMTANNAPPMTTVKEASIDGGDEPPAEGAAPPAGSDG